MFINGHGGNVEVLNFIGQRARTETGARIIRVDWWVIAADEIMKICEREVIHADEGEMSMLLACRPELVNMTRAVKDETANNLIQKLTSGKPKNMPKVYLPFEAWTKTGLIGDATKATREKGERILEAVVNNIIDFLGQVNKLP